MRTYPVDYGCAHDTTCVLKSENNLEKSLLSVPHMHPGAQNQVIRFGGRSLFLVSHLTGPVPSFKIEIRLARRITWPFLKAPIALSEKLGMMPRTHIAFANSPRSSNNALFWPLGELHACGTQLFF